MKTEKKFVKRTLIMLLILFCFIQSVNLLPAQIGQIAAAKETDYSKYSNTKYGWYIVRKGNHEKAGGGIPQGLKLSDYDAYYMNEKTNEKVIYLSFDCGYENGYTKSILRTLKKHKAKAIFFVTKSFIENNPELVKQMKDDGHLVGNHTCTHPSLPDKSVYAIKKEIKDCEKAFEKVTGYKMDPFIRPPMGEYSKRTLKVTKDLGYKTIFWSIAYYDYDVNKQPGKDYVIEHFKNNYHKGALPLIHNTSSSNCAALNDVLTYLEEQNYRFGTLDEFTLPKGELIISCKNKIYDKEPAEIKVVKNTNKEAKITFEIKNEEGDTVKKAVKPGRYTVVARVESSRTYRYTRSNKVKFTIRKRNISKNNGGYAIQKKQSEKKIYIKKPKSGLFTLKEGKTKNLKVRVGSEKTPSIPVKWTSSNKEIATVSKQGEVLAKREGLVTVTAALPDTPDKKASVKIKVIPKSAFIYKNGFYCQKISSELKEKMEGKSYKKNPDISYRDLRYISLRHYGYDGKVKNGELVVNKKIAKDMLKIFYELFQEKYQIQSMKLVDDYGADDNKSMEANNTSAFNYRKIAGTNILSNHAYGMAIDINPRINPYVIGESYVSPSNGKEYGERDVAKCKGRYKENMIHKNDVIYKLFKKYGFSWGGEWEDVKDYQHFEKLPN